MGHVMAKIETIDFRLLDAIELDALEEHLQLIESQMEHIQKTARREFDIYSARAPEPT